MKFYRLLLVLAILPYLASAASAATPPNAHPIALSALSGISDIATNEIRAGRIPGAVIIVGHDGKVVYRHAFGDRSLGAAPVPMAPDTIFDLASVTKVVATTAAIMQLVEQKRIALDKPVAAYWPEFAKNGKAQITVCDLMTHYSGLPADLDTSGKWRGYRSTLRRIVGLRPVCPRATRYIYSDVNFEVLGELVRRISGTRLDEYCRGHIFAPLHMTDTFFRVPRSKRERVAPTDRSDDATSLPRVEDPTAYRMGGIAGHAGLFSTAGDLSIFAQMMINGGSYGSARILRASSIEQMTAPMSPRGEAPLRGLGWDLGPPLAANRYQLPPIGSFGHKGYTGTMLWIDPASSTYVIVLSNRVYMNRDGDAEPLRTRILALVSEAIGNIPQAEILARFPEIAASFKNGGADSREKKSERVMTGADVLEAEHFAPLKHRRVALITNRSGVDGAGNDFARIIRATPDVKLVAIFTPEHGLSGRAEGKVESATDSETGIPIVSLYGDTRRPTDAMLSGIDAMVFDVQDSGARYYTYATTMAYAMEAAARRSIDFYVLDRPNPISAAVVQGVVMDPEMKSFTGYFSSPTRHGMTIGELAEMFNGENRIGARLHVIAMRHYHRAEWYDETGLPWIAPSPNLRTLEETILYPGVGMVEGANISVGRGTASPFELIGAPWMTANILSSYLNSRAIAGVHFEPVDFAPSSDTYAHQDCYGVRIRVEDRDALDSPALGIEIIAALHRLYPDKFELGRTLAMVGSKQVLEQVRAGEDPRIIVDRYGPALRNFRMIRAKYLLY